MTDADKNASTLFWDRSDRHPDPDWSENPELNRGLLLVEISALAEVCTLWALLLLLLLFGTCFICQHWRCHALVVPWTWVRCIYRLQRYILSRCNSGKRQSQTITLLLFLAYRVALKWGHLLISRVFETPNQFSRLLLQISKTGRFIHLIICSFLVSVKIVQISRGFLDHPVLTIETVSDRTATALLWDLIVVSLFCRRQDISVYQPRGDSVATWVVFH